MKEVLKPCPFCGSSKVVLDGNNKAVGVRYRCVCTECMAMVAPGTFQRPDDAIRAWNLRTDHRCGEWLHLRKNYSKCSVCGTAYSHPVAWEPYKFCSECGAMLINKEE